MNGKQGQCQKLKISITSDRHHEFGWDYLTRDTLPVDADIYVLAGDIDVGTRALEWAASLGKPVLYVPGNHEFYRGNLEQIEYAFREESKSYPNVDVLQNDVVVMGDTRFLGTVLWTDYEIYNNAEYGMTIAEHYLADHRLITTGLGKNCCFFSAKLAQQRHIRNRTWLEMELQKQWSGKTVVITHHAPHSLSVNQRFSGDPLTPAFASDLTEILSTYDIDIWLHGHMHDPVNYTLFDTRVICNPRGYEGTDETNNFTPNLIIEI
ncbi:metallophosphoesterase [Zhongshania aquimaris]|jgi:Icc-related predicted phosphoesterase|uniref:Metallophosphoesterase n=1 Tax=Zhongshania aquimaris TaxID=2857107 RepID=A0ABS6VQF9_9GAMM|nr:metallophosphoesterase [Zhongshania aquimaris]MBQ0759791.1 metallophosphoesterase [Zhongshania sp.]MBW2940552.1 metallophosphoesterase [Zhongshania aquimaris]